MIDITMHNAAELADLFDNDEGLYNAAIHAKHFSELEEIAEEYFTYTNAQMDVLREDWNNGRWN